MFAPINLEDFIKDKKELEKLQRLNNLVSSLESQSLHSFFFMI